MELRLSYSSPGESCGARREIGSLLVDAGALTPEHLALALAEQETSGRRLGEIVVARGYATSATVAKALAEQLGLRYIDLGSTAPQPDAVALLPEKRRPADDARRAGRAADPPPLERALRPRLARHVGTGVTSYDEVRRVTGDRLA